MNSTEILDVLDEACGAFKFPMLDNGYIYMAATRMSLFRSASDWGLVIEIFGFSPRTGAPDTCIYTFASRLRARKSESDFVTLQAYRNYLANNPHNEARSVFPIENEDWIDPENTELVNSSGEIQLRDLRIALPPVTEYTRFGIALESEQPAVFELCRYLATGWRDRVLATPDEQRANTPPELNRILVLEEWYHPNVVADELPSGCETFRQLADVLVTGDIACYRPLKTPNTHWRHWPEGGRL